MENGGATVKDIARRLEINESAARSLVGDLRADKVSIVAMKIIGERGVMYHV
jgi:Mn-dependent DtxR family transcriptional regulator